VSAGARLTLRTSGTQASKRHLYISDCEAMTLVLWQEEFALRDHVAHGAATLAKQMVMGLEGVRVVTLRPRIERDFADLAEFLKLVERVVY
jgi:hypothetical protein